MSINRLAKYDFAISQSISGSFRKGDTIEASFLAKGNSAGANQYVTQFVDLQYSVSSESISLLRFPKGTFPERFYVGNTYTGRGIEKIIELSKFNKEIFFLIVGGEDSDNILYQKKINDSQKNILFTGHVKNSDIPNFLAISDILLIPYDTDFTIKGGSKALEYSSPIKLFEYLSSGKPIILNGILILC